MDNDAARIDRPSQLTGPLDNHYLFLREDKAPISWDTYALDDVENSDTVGIMIPEPYVVIDVDDAEQADKLLCLVTEQDINCQIMQTTRGRHFWFKAPTPLKNSVKSMTGLGIYVDYRSWGKKSEVCVRFKGQWREWLTDYDWNELPELPRWLYSLNQTKWTFYNMGEGDGRNQALFDYQIMLSKRGYAKAEAFDVLRLINDYIFTSPMPDREINTICRDEAYPDLLEPGEEVDPTLDGSWRGPRGGFSHDRMGNMLIEEMKIVYYQRQYYTYHNGYYQVCDNEVEHAITELFPAATKKQKGEVLDYIRIMSHIKQPQMNVFTINVKNGRLDLKTGKLTPHTPEAHDFQQLNATYDPSAYCEPVEKMIRKVFCDDQQLIDLFEEVMGYCLLKDCPMQTLIIFFGDGSNGKSTIMRMIRNFIGAGNYSTLSIQDLESQFRPADLENKLVNIGDDIPATQIKDSSKLKSLSRGEEVTVERKNKPPFSLKNYAKLIFSTNKIPPSADKSHGFYRSLTLIPFDATFSREDADFDPYIEQKVILPEAMSYLLNIAVRGYKRMTEHGFTKSNKVDKALDNYKQFNSHTLMWIADNDITEDYLLQRSTSELFYEFKNWCADEGIEKLPIQKTFTTEVLKKFNLTLSDQRREPGTSKRVKFFIKPSV
jgi:putative DNA primase/helicase